jgi:hypothetical protein
MRRITARLIPIVVAATIAAQAGLAGHVATIAGLKGW